MNIRKSCLYNVSKIDAVLSMKFLYEFMIFNKMRKTRWHIKRVPWLKVPSRVNSEIVKSAKKTIIFEKNGSFLNKMIVFDTF